MEGGNTSPNLLSEEEAEATMVGNGSKEKAKRAKILTQEEYNEILHYKIR